ncbi:MAG: TonB-dependent receptor [Sphingomonadaceae bacterium]|nr:TonB-dependent receptor [Sphingomonadaceae bacterium]
MRHTSVAARLLAGTAVMITCGFAGTALAQDASDSYGVSDIIVTAQKREQSLQDVPLAVTALDKDAIKVNRVVNAANLTGLAPGFVARLTAGALGSVTFAMRGVNASPSVPAQDKQISMYIDGVYIGGSRGSLSELMEVEQVEVLRGPQGTLFGRNSTAGAVSIVTRNPTGELAFRQDVTVGNQSQLRTRTTIDTPSIGPFSGYVTYIHEEKKGDVRNLGAGVQWNRINPFTDVRNQTSPKTLGGRNYENIFAALRFDNGGSVKATYKFDLSKGKFVADARTTPVVNPDDFLGGMLASIIAAQPAGGGKFGPVALNTSDRRPDAYNSAWQTPGFQRVQGHNLTLDWQVSDSVAVKNIAAYRKTAIWAGGSSIAGLSGLEFTAGAVMPYAIFAAASAVPGFGDLPPATQGAIIGQYAQGLAPLVGSYFAPYEGQSYGTHWQFSEEVQVNYTADRLDVTAGALFFKSSTDDSGLPGFTPNFAFRPIPQTLPLGDVTRSIGKTQSIAAYIQAEYAFTPEFGVVVGGRYTKDKKHGDFERGGTLSGDRNTGEIVGTVVQPFTFKSSKPTYSIGLNYEPTDDFMVYAKYSTGFLSGGAVADISFPPETAKSWEAGFKADLLDRRVRLNMAFWDVEYKNAQASASGASVGRRDLNIAVVSHGALKARGVEAELVLAPARGLTFGGTIGYTESKFVNPDPIVDQGNGIIPASRPKWVGSANAMYITPPLFGDATMLFRLDATYESRVRIIPDPNVEVKYPVFGPFEFMPSKVIVNGRVALRDIDMGGANVEIGLWSKNLLDNKKPLYPFQYPNFLMTTTYEPARTFGVDVIVKYKP